MFKLLHKLIIGYFSKRAYLLPKEDKSVGEINGWLHESKCKGWEQYYRLRKIYLLGHLATAVTNKEYWKTCGKLEELLILENNINYIVKKKVKR